MELANPPTIEIVRDPETCGGSPRIAGTRMPVHDLVSYAQLYDGDLTKVQADFPYLTLETLQAVMAWYAENREEIDGILRARRERSAQRLAPSPAGS
jgi:uncharacterized protein (DUF433 family)